MLQSIHLRDAKVWLPTAKQTSSLVADERSQRSCVLYLNLVALKSHVPTGLLNIEFLVNNLCFHTELYF